MLNLNHKPDISTAIHLASLSPSSHNCQPWGLTYLTSEFAKKYLKDFASDSESTIAYLILSLDRSRCLSTLPAHELEMLLSCGAFLESLFLGLQAQNLSASIVWVNESMEINPFSPVIPLREYWLPLAIISINPLKVANLWKLSQQKVIHLSKRKTNRGIYSPTPLSSDVIDVLKNINSITFPKAYSCCQVILIESSKTINQLGKFVKTHGTAEFAEDKVWKETYQWMRFGKDNIQNADSGLPITQMVGTIPTEVQWLLKQILSPSIMKILKNLGLPQLLATNLGNLVGSSPLLAYLNFIEREPTVSEQLSGGAVWLDFCLKATELGLAVHPISVVLQHPKIYHKLIDNFTLPHGRGFFFCRVGYPYVSASNAPKRTQLLNEILIG